MLMHGDCVVCIYGMLIPILTAQQLIRCCGELAVSACCMLTEIANDM